ncbi:hypothetical protein CDAR_61761 [Caerostris darwini]|uniref:Uncharacterized protein n=1 Tax=Caerostris darwini TaxID=1538125 RepID=A0AAV4VJ25_9ARAC|nr:hypothetical protein CDAR_61761 [Caerostris darwini]
MASNNGRRYQILGFTTISCSFNHFDVDTSLSSVLCVFGLPNKSSIVLIRKPQPHTKRRDMPKPCRYSNDRRNQRKQKTTLSKNTAVRRSSCLRLLFVSSIIWV